MPLAEDIKPLFSGMGVPVTVRAGDAQRALLNLGSVAPLCCVMGQAPRNKPKRLGEKLLRIRKAHGLSQKEMAKRLAKRTGFKITNTHVSHYERDSAEPFLETTLAYARVGKVTFEQIVDDDLDLPL